MSESKRKKLLAICVVGICICIVLIAGMLSRRHVDLAEYVRCEYTGVNGCAEVVCVVERDKLYEELAGTQKDMEKRELYRRFADSVSAKAEQKDIRNGDKIHVTVKCDDQLAKQAGIQVGNRTFTVRAGGIGDGVKVDLFEHVEVVFAGISPEAYVVVKNNWADESLKNLRFQADKSSGVTVGDVIVISCSATKEELAKNGIVAQRYEQEYTADKLSSYASGAKAVSAEVLNDIDIEAREAIIRLTADNTFRILYKATEDEKYLHQINEEKAEQIELLGEYFLKRKNAGEGNADNYLYLIYRADVSNGSETLPVYFGFEYMQGYVTVEGEFNIAHEAVDERYACSADYEKLYHTLIGSKSDRYQVQEMTK